MPFVEGKGRAHMSKRTGRSRRFVESIERRILLAAQPQFLDDFDDLFDIFDQTFDYTFDGNSLVTTDAEVLDDGSLVIGGYDLTFFEPQAFVARFDKFGDLDPTFNGGDIAY